MSVKKPTTKTKEKSPRSTETAQAVKRKPSIVEKDAAEATDRVMDSRSCKDRRYGDRRQTSEPVDVDRRVGQRREKVNRRRQIDPTTCERDYSADEIEFMSALDDYKRRSGRMFPTCSEVLEVIRGLGYEKRTAIPVAMLAVEPVAAVAATTEQAV